ncbi:MAG: LVIVD repeat-containing protein [Actinomycetota bacterium]
MRRIVSVAAAIVLGAGLAVPATGAPETRDVKSDTIKRLAQVPIKGAQGKANGSDLAFQGDLLVAGTYDGLGLFRILRGKPYLNQLSFFDCPGSQGDVSVYGDYVFYSIDSTGSNQGTGGQCNNTDDSALKEGIRIIDISNVREPRQVKFVETECGSHTHTMLPRGNNVYIYVLSYPIVQEPACNVASHRKISVIKVPVNNPAKAKIVSTPGVATTIGCHDVTVFPSKDLAAAACISEGQMWDISDPANPEIIARIYNPSINIWHSGAITWDGKYAVFGDEFLGSITGTCTGPQQNSIGAMWFYDISDPTTPLLAGYYGVPRAHPVPSGPDEAAYLKCTTHNYNLLPMRDGNRYLATVGLRSSGMTVVDFTDPTSPQEIAYFQDGQTLPDTWSAYWYNGRVYTNDNASLLGIGVFEVKGTGADQVRYFEKRMNPQTQIKDLR